MDKLLSNDTCKNNCEFYDLCFSNLDSCVKKSFFDVLETLTPREEQTLKLLYGFDSKKLSDKEVAEQLGLTTNRISQIEAKALRKLRHPSRSKFYKNFLFEVFTVSKNNFYATLLSNIFGETLESDKILFGIRLGGIDFSLIDENVKANKTPSEIQEELNSSIDDFSHLSDFSSYLKKFGIVKFNHLLHTSRSKLLFDVFSCDDVIYFKLIKQLSTLGYKIKNEDQECVIFNLLLSELWETISPSKIYDDVILDLPLETTMLLFEKGITTIDELISQIHNINVSDAFTEDAKRKINLYLESKKLLYSFNQNATLYLSKSAGDFCVQLLKWLIDNCHSVFQLKNELQSQKLYYADAIHYIVEKHPDFNYNDTHIRMSSLDMPITELPLSVRTFNCLYRCGINTVKDLISKSMDDLIRIRNIGRLGISEIVDILDRSGLALRQNDDDVEAEDENPESEEIDSNID